MQVLIPKPSRKTPGRCSSTSGNWTWGRSPIGRSDQPWVFCRSHASSDYVADTGDHYRYRIVVDHRHFRRAYLRSIVDCRGHHGGDYSGAGPDPDPRNCRYICLFYCCFVGLSIVVFRGRDAIVAVDHRGRAAAHP